MAKNVQLEKLKYGALQNQAVVLSLGMCLNKFCVRHWKTVVRDNVGFGHGAPTANN
jgi:hypothetical protein